jgi:exosortase
MSKKSIWLSVPFAASFIFLFRGPMVKLVHDWIIDNNYSHGFIVAPIALYFAWRKRDEFRLAPLAPSSWGLLIVIASIGLLVAGTIGAEVFTSEVALLGVIAGSLLYLAGWSRLRVMAFPIAFLFLMIPIPSIIFNQVAFPLQLLASQFGESALVLFRIPVLREGNVIHLANTSLEVVEACSGIRSLISLLTLGIVYGYFSDSRNWVRFGIALMTVPVAIVANGCRVAGTGIAAHRYGAEVAEGFLHTFSGWFVFIAAFLLLFAFHRALLWLSSPPELGGVAAPQAQTGWFEKGTTPPRA